MWKKLFVVCLSINVVVTGRELLPPFPDTLSVEPKIPDTFVMGPNPDLYSSVIWGEQEAIDRLLNFHKIDSVFFFVRLSGDVIQQDAHTFSDEFAIPDRLSIMGYSQIDVQKAFWGKHPVLITRYLDETGRACFRAWIGLNSCKGGWVLSVSFQYPESHKSPTSEEVAIWKNFLCSAN